MNSKKTLPKFMQHKSMNPSKEPFEKDPNRIDYIQLSRELIKAIRGKRSQNWVNKRLDANSNICYRWESGNKNIYWNEFVKLCEIFKIPLKDILHNSLLIQGDINNSSELLILCLGDQNQDWLLYNPEISPKKLSRLLKGTDTASLAIMLKAIHFYQRNLFGFLEKVLEEVNLPSVNKEYKKFCKTRELIYDNPIISLISISINLDQYTKNKHPTHQDLANLTNLEIDVLEFFLKKMLEYKILKRSGNHYVDESSVQQMIGPSFEQIKNLKLHWIKTAHDKIASQTKPNPKIQSGYLVYPSNEKMDKQFSQLYLKFYEFFNETMRFSKDIENSKTSVRLLNINLVPLTDEIDKH